MTGKNATLERIAALSLLLLLAAALFLAALRLPDAQFSAAEKTLSALPSLERPEALTHTIEVKALDGVLCVFRDGVLSQRTSISVLGLPSADQAEAEQGIRVGSEAALQQLLEDLGS